MLSTTLLILCGALTADAPAGTALSDAMAHPITESVRLSRPVSVAFELGNSGLAGMGINVGYSFSPRWALDTGLGLSVFGVKVGVRGRYNFLKSNVTPFVGLGAMAAAAPWNSTQVVPMGQAVGGLAWLTDGGFSLLASLGWMQRLDGEQGRSPIPFVWTGSDIVCSLATGYAF